MYFAGDTTTTSTTVSTIALFAGVIGVALGWLLAELTKLVKWLADGRQRRLAEERTRVLDFILSAETFSTAANGLGVVYAVAAGGKSADRSQAASIVSQFNEAAAGLARVRLVMAILGPKWVGTHTVAVENGAIGLQSALRDAEQKKDKSSFQTLLDKIGEFQVARESLIKAAQAHYSKPASGRQS